MKDESKIKETLQLTQFALDHAPDAVYWMEPDGRFFYVNETACRTLGYTREELLSMGVADIDPNLSDGVPPEMYEATKKAGVGRVETEHLTKDGRIIPVEVMVAYIEYKGKEYHCSFVRDITERKQAEEARNFLSIMTEQISSSVITTDLNYRITYTNKAFQDLYGYTTQEIVGKSLDMFNAEPDAEQIRQEIYEKVSHGEVWRGELVNRKKDGSHFICDLMVYPLLDKQGKIIAYTGLQQDITKRKKAEEALLESNRTLAKAQEIANIGSWTWDVDTNKITWSDELFNIYGLDKEKDAASLTAKLIQQMTHPDDLKRVLQNAEKALKEGKVQPIEYRILRPDKTERIVYVESELSQKAEYGNSTKLVGVVQDITERKRAEEELKEKFDEINRMNRLMVGRELKMVELKREIRELKARTEELKKKQTIK